MQYHQVTTIAALYRPSTIKYRSYRLILIQFLQIPTSSALYWPSATKYQPVFERVSTWKIFSQLDIILIHVRGRVWPGLPVIFQPWKTTNGDGNHHRGAPQSWITVITQIIMLKMIIWNFMMVKRRIVIANLGLKNPGYSVRLGNHSGVTEGVAESCRSQQQLIF